MEKIDLKGVLDVIGCKSSMDSHSKHRRRLSVEASFGRVMQAAAFSEYIIAAGGWRTCPLALTYLLVASELNSLSLSLSLIMCSKESGRAYSWLSQAVSGRRLRDLKRIHKTQGKDITK